MIEQNYTQENSQGKPLVLLGVFELIKNAFNIFKSRMGLFIGIVAVPIILSFIYGLISASIVGGSFIFLSIQNKIDSPAFWSQIGFFILITVIFCLIISVVSLWGYLATIFAIKSPETGIAECFKKTLPILGSSMWIGVLTGLAVFVGFFLLIIPGFIFAIWYSLATFVLIDDNLKGTAALSKSKEYISGYFWPVVGRFLCLGIFAWICFMVSAIIPVIGPLAASFFLQSFAVIYFYLIYSNLKDLKTISITNQTK